MTQSKIKIYFRYSQTGLLVPVSVEKFTAYTADRDANAYRKELNLIDLVPNTLRRKN